MRRHKNGIILTAFLLLSGLAYLLGNPEALPFNKKAKLMFPEFKKREISRIEVRRGGEGADILRIKDGKWIVENEEGFPADKEAIESALSAVGRIKERELVSKRKENWGNFGVGESGTKVSLIGKEGSFKFVVGSRGPGFGKSYIRRADEDKVYLVNESLDLTFGAGDWRDLSIKIQNPKSKIQNMLIENARGVYGLKKSGDKWKLVKPQKNKEIAQSRAEDLVSRLANLEAADATVSAELAETGLDEPAVRVAVSDGKSKSTLIIGNKNKQGQRFAQVSGNPYIYLLSPSDYGVFEDISAEYFTEEKE